MDDVCRLCVDPDFYNSFCADSPDKCSTLFGSMSDSCLGNCGEALQLFNVASWLSLGCAPACWDPRSSVGGGGGSSSGGSSNFVVP